MMDKNIHKIPYNYIISKLYPSHCLMSLLLVKVNIPSLSLQVLCRAVSATEVLKAQQVVKNEHGEEVSSVP